MSNRRRRKRSKGPLVVLVIIILLICAIGAFLYHRYAPTSEQADLESYFSAGESGDAAAADGAALIVNRTRYGNAAIVSEDQIYLDLSVVQSEINGRFYWDDNEKLLIYTTPSTVIKASPDNSAYYVSNMQQNAEYTIVKYSDGRPYLNICFVQQYSDVEYTLYEDPQRVVVQSDWSSVNVATVTKDSAVRIRGGVKSPVLTEVAADTGVTVLEDLDDWVEIYTEDGYRGYIKSDVLSETTVYESERSFEEEVYTSISRDHKINLTWHQVTSTVANNNIASVLNSAPGINVISPTWFYLNDSAGNINSIATSDYVNYAHENGIEVWGLVSNLEADVDTTAVLTHTTSRELLESKLIAAAIEYKLDGINVDFEDISSEVGDSYIQFIRELGILCRNNNIVLSVDVPPSLWTTAFYNRAEMAEVADYVILMAYDEHYNGSEAGSVSSINWASGSVTDLLAEVPAEKLIFGMPLYTRLWEIENGTVTSATYGMEDIQNLIAENNATITWDETSGQNYAEYTKDGAQYQVWIEDATSIEERMQIMKNNQLAGVATWKVGFETSDIWTVISTNLQ